MERDLYSVGQVLPGNASLTPARQADVQPQLAGGGQATELDLSVRDLTKSYGRVVAVAGVSFDVRKGEIVSLLGPSGCGKTTTLRAIVGLIKPSTGTIIIKSRDVTRLPVHKRNIGMLFQNYALFPHLTVAENIGFGLRLRSLPKMKISEEVEKILELVGLTGYESRYISQLSGGQQQRVALARALVIEPELLLLDEPFGALDKKLRERMQVEMKSLQARLGITTILVTHDQEEALTLSDTVVVMHDGRIEQMGAPTDVYERPATAFVADFIGLSNVFYGRLRKAESGWQVEADGGLDLRIQNSQHDVSEGDRVSIMVRPEKIRLSVISDRRHLPNAIEVTIEHTVYRGIQTYVYLRGCKGLMLIASTSSDEVKELNQQVSSDVRLMASWESAANHIIPIQ